jgi:hypothetical protein
MTTASGLMGWLVVETPGPLDDPDALCYPQTHSPSRTWSVPFAVTRCCGPDAYVFL